MIVMTRWGGLHFNEVDIPQGATIVKAYVQFQVDETSSLATSLTIEGEDIDDAQAFTSSAGDISSRTRTTAEVTWDPETLNRGGTSRSRPADAGSVFDNPGNCGST